LILNLSITVFIILLIKSLKVTFTDGDMTGIEFLEQWEVLYPLGVTCKMVAATGLSQFTTCLKSVAISQVVVFGNPEDVIRGLKSLNSAGAIGASTLLFAANSWGTDEVMARVISESGLALETIKSTFTTRPTTGDYSLFGYCLSELTVDYDPQYVTGYDSSTGTEVESYMPLATYKAFWQSTFDCVANCTSDMKLNEKITIHVYFLYPSF
jgi:hypothetical protein